MKICSLKNFFNPSEEPGDSGGYEECIALLITESEYKYKY